MINIIKLFVLDNFSIFISQKVFQKGKLQQEQRDSYFHFLSFAKIIKKPLMIQDKIEKVLSIYIF